MPLKIKIGAAAEEKKPIQAQIALQITKTMDGNILISDHKYLDIIIDLKEAKVITMPKPHVEKDVYDYQKDLMYSLFKGGVSAAVAPRGGPVFGMVECSFPKEGEIDNVQAVLYQISEYIKKTSHDEQKAERYDQNIEDRFTDPDDADSTAYGEIKPYQDTPAGANDSLPTYAYAGYGYYY
jgi:hypothetical protein|tara:strand:- start:111 stop:653 length:543 start_codon:yes stop_codon:yes gene_type:complete